MEKKLKILLQKTLNEYGKIEFDVTFETKGSILELVIGEKRNEECGDIYDELDSWLGYDQFIDYLISHGVQHNFSGEIFKENEEICFNLILAGYCYDWDDSDKKHFYFEEEFITNTLKINLSEIGMDEFNEENVSVSFSKMKGLPIEQLELTYYKNGWYQFNLDKDQYQILNEFIESEIEKAVPTYDIDFDCEVIWEAYCEDYSLEFSYYSSPIKLKLNEIDSK